MNDFLNDLYCAFLEDIRPPKGDPEYEQAIQTYMKLEAEVKEKLGPDLLSRYQRAHSDTFEWEKTAIFTSGLRFGAQFMLEVLR